MAIEVGRRKLGSQGLEVSALGLGCMGLSMSYRGAQPPEDIGIALIRHAFDKGVTFFDTSDVYGPLKNEVLLGQALKGLPREKIQVATKFGYSFTKDGGLTVRGSPEYVRQACEASLQRLDVDYIDLYYQHRVDAEVPIEETVGELKTLVEEGKIKYVGLSEASASTIRRAHAVHPISAVQIEWSLWTRDVEPEIVPTCRYIFREIYKHGIEVNEIQTDETIDGDFRELGIGIVPYSPLGRGFFSGNGILEKLQEGDSRLARQPRFQGENFEKNKVLYERVAALAKKHGCSPGQLALAWVLHQGEDVVPIPGTTKVTNFDENLGSLNVRLSKEDLDEVVAAVPEDAVAGTRHSTFMMKWTWMHVETPPLKHT